MILPDIETRKKHTNLVINQSSYILNAITNDANKSAYILLYFHILLVGLPLLYIFFGKVNVYYYLSVLFWFLIMFLHFYFHGCIFIKIERNLWDVKEWYGPWLYVWKCLDIMGIEITNKLANNIFICWGIFLILFIFLKTIYNMD
jgi:hypothetical protein